MPYQPIPLTNMPPDGHATSPTNPAAQSHAGAGAGAGVTINADTSAETSDPLATKTAVDSLYIHVPFCFHKCHYCDFYSIVDTQQRQARFADALICELTQLADQYLLQPTTIFAGGGTPTLLEPIHWQRFLRVAQTLGILNRIHEFTVEANPETVTDELAHILATGGVNRISIGAQSFNPTLLKTLERWHEPANVQRSMTRLRNAGINNINLDLIFGIPGQTLDNLADDIDRALALQPTHLSCYSLTFEPKTALTARRDRGEIQPIDTGIDRDMYAYLLDRLDDAGYDHYEISAWSKRPPPHPPTHSPTLYPHATPAHVTSPTLPLAATCVLDTNNTRPPIDYRCQHNLAYWRNQNWLGIGPGAASHINNQRWKNLPHLARYIDTSPTPARIDHEHLTHAEQQSELLMMGLRLRDGIAIEPAQFPTHTQQEIQRYITVKMLEYHHNRLRFTREGLFVADCILADLIPS